jgi:hypothetical protein
MPAGSLPMSFVRANSMGFLFLVDTKSQAEFAFRMAYTGHYGSQVRNGAIASIGVREFVLQGLCERPR